jgi:hypothetical protein
MQIFITSGEDKSGPFTLDQVREHLEQGVLLPDDLAFHDGLDDWIPLSELMDSDETALDGATENAGRKKKLFLGIGATVVVLAVAAAFLFFLEMGKTKSGSSGNLKQVGRFDPLPPLDPMAQFTSGQVTERPTP